MTFEEIDKDVDRAIRNWFKKEYPGVRFSYSRRPDQPLNPNGLGATWNGWRLLLFRLKAKQLPKKPCFKELDIGTKLIDDTYTKQLTSLRRQLVKRVFTCANNPRAESKNAKK